MSHRLNEYLTQETADYLGQLEQLLEEPGAPDLDRLMSLTRGVRGSAQMAGAEMLSAVAERLEDAVRSVVEKHVAWSEEIRALAVQTVRDLQILVRALNRWGPAEETRVRTAIERWDDLDQGGDPRLRVVDGGGVVPVASLFYDDEGPHLLSRGEPPVPIESLLLAGEEAVEAAVEVAEALETELRDRGALDGSVADLVAELFTLLNQSRVAAAPQP